MTAERKKPRRGRGEGSIYYRKREKRWCAQVSHSVYGKGRVRKTVYGETKDDVVQALEAEKRKQHAGMMVAPSDLTVSVYLERWLKLIADRLAESTLVDYGRVVERSIVPLIGEIVLQRLTASHVEYMLAELKTRKDARPSPRTKQYILQILSSALKAAVKKTLIPSNPCDAIDRPKARRRQMQVLDVDQAERFRRAAERHPLFAIYILALDTGARRGELLGLKWSDINFQTSTMSIGRACALINGNRQVIKDPKTEKGRRQITLPQRTLAVLRRHQKEQLRAGCAGHEWLFCDERGKIIVANPVTRGFHRILKTAKLPSIRFHDLRHTHASLLFSAGVHPKIVQERLGHSTISQTMDCYSHLIPSMQGGIQAQLNALFG